MTSPDFVQAQERLAARRAAREAEAKAATQARRDASIRQQQLAKLPSPLRQLTLSSLNTWDAISGREGTRPAFRVGQVDAELLDEELLDLLKGQVGEALKYYGSHIQDDWAAEIMLLLRAVLFKLTIWDHDASYGAALQNLKYTDARQRGPVLVPPSKWQKALYGLISVGGSYAWTKWEDWLTTANSGDDYEEPSPRVKRLTRLSTALSTIYGGAALTSFLIFLTNGRYRTLLDRILRMRLATPSSQISREVSFEYLNRQLVWHAFTEFLLFVLPLVGISRWRRWLSRAWRKTKSVLNSDEDGASTHKTGELAFLPERTCAICYQDQNAGVSSEADVLAASASAAAGGGGGVIGSAATDITNPYETVPCGCVYCFVCLAGRLEAEGSDGWVCLRCGEVVKECKPWSGDVLVVKEKEKEGGEEKGKSVGFSETPADLPSGEKEKEKSSEAEEKEDDDQEFQDAEDGVDKSSDDNSEGYEEDEDNFID